MDKRILIVDDAAFVREILRGIFEKNGYLQVIEACDGPEAVETALKYKPDIIFMDLVLPDKNGMDAAKEILEKLPNIQIVACTTLTNEHILLQAMDVGFSSYLSKPFNEHEVLQAIHERPETFRGVGA